MLCVLRASVSDSFILTVLVKSVNCKLFMSFSPFSCSIFLCVQFPLQHFILECSQFPFFPDNERLNKFTLLSILIFVLGKDKKIKDSELNIS